MRDPIWGTILPTEDGLEALPLHLHASASEVELPGNGDEVPRDVSVIFRTTYENFRKLGEARVLKIFEHRHILITDCPVDAPSVWGPETFQLFGPLEQFLPAQGQSIPSRHCQYAW